jgi:hypothetical protein
MFTEYENLLKQFHRALIQRDLVALRSLLSDSAKVNLDQEPRAIKQLNLPLSDDINVTGIAIEGNGKVITVYYINRVARQEYSMIAYLRRTDDTIKLDHFLPQLKK